MNAYEIKLLEGWEEAYRRGQLTLWCLLALKAGPKHMAEIKKFFDTASQLSFSVDDQSLYRALRRFNKADLITYTTEPGLGGPDRKIYELTGTGRTTLTSFLRRNIDPFYAPSLMTLIGGE